MLVSEKAMLAADASHVSICCCLRVGMPESMIRPASADPTRGGLSTVRRIYLRQTAGARELDTGLGVEPIRPVAQALTPVPVEAVNSHYHFDHTGGNAEFDSISIHELGAPLLAQGVSSPRARRVAEGGLTRAAVADCAGMHPEELSGAEHMRVAIARALAAAPKMLVIDDPTAGVGLTHGDGILRLLREVADAGVAVLMSTDDATCISGADRAFSLDDGELRNEVQAPRADVVPLRPHALGVGSGTHLA